MARWIPWILLAVACGGSGDDGNGPDGVAGDDDDDDAIGDTDDTDTDDPIPGDCAAVTAVTVEDTPAILQKTLQVTTDASTQVWAVCTAAGDPAERILAESTAEGTSHSLLVAGLYADESWTCEVAATCDGATSTSTTIQTNSLPADLHRGVRTQNPSLEPVGQWTMFNTAQACFGNAMQYVQIVDLQGRVRWAKGVGTQFEVDIDASWTGDRIHYGGGWGLFDASEPHRGLIRQLDLAGNPLLELDEPQFGLGYNHHSEVLPGGDILSLTTHEDTDGSTTWDGIGIEKLDPTGTTVEWTWASQKLFDDGVVPAQFGSPWHNNSVEWITDTHGDAVWVSLYVGQQIWRIDRDSGDRTHVFGPGGDFTWLDSDGSPLPQEKWTWGQHDPDHTGDGRVLMYDNGVDRPGGNYSRVFEFDLDLDARTATMLWEWTENDWYTPIIGDADYLDDDHVLVAKGVVDCLTFWIDQVSGVIEVDKASGDPVWRYDMEDDAIAIFRAHRYDGCEIFDNAATCTAVADRIGELEALLAR